MDLHANAVLTVRQRQRLCDLVSAGAPIGAAALVVAAPVRPRRSGSIGDVEDRGCSIARAGPIARREGRPASVERAILRARLELREGPHVIGWALGVAASTVQAVLRRHGRSRLVVRSEREQVFRYERSSPGELVHVDCKKLGRILRPGHRVTGDRSSRARGSGWHYLYVAIDDHSRLGFACLYPDDTAATRSPS